MSKIIEGVGTVIAYEYKGHRIELLAARPEMFTVSGSLLERSESTDSFDKAKTIVDHAYSTKNKSERIKLSLPVIDDYGRKHIVTGVHAGHGKLMGLAENSGAQVFPDVPWVRDALVEINKITVRRNVLENLVHAYRISVNRSYGRVDPDRYAAIVEILKAEHQRVTEEALEKQAALEKKAKAEAAS